MNREEKPREYRTYIFGGDEEVSGSWEGRGSHSEEFTVVGAELGGGKHEGEGLGRAKAKPKKPQDCITSLDFSLPSVGSHSLRLLWTGPGTLWPSEISLTAGGRWMVAGRDHEAQEI